VRMEAHEHLGPGWRLEVPEGVIGGPAERLTNPELLSSSIFRGWVGEQPFSVIVSTRERAGTTLRRTCRRIATDFRNAPGEGREVDVPGAKGARRLDGLIDIEEGLGEPPHWTERLTVVVAAAAHELVLLTVRRRPESDLEADVEQVVSSLRVLDGVHPSRTPTPTGSA
jgi:hypothetical protein